MKNYINLQTGYNYCINYRVLKNSFLTASMLYSALCIVSLWTCSLAFPLLPKINRTYYEQWEVAEEYLNKFYAYSPEPQKKHFENKVKEMQKFFRLEETGLLNHKTMEIIQKPRCGVPDVQNFQLYPFTPKWPSNVVTYRIVSYTSDLPRYKVDQLVEQALGKWSEVSALTFKKVLIGDADIRIGFARGAHGDFYPFDGPGGILAHAFEPGIGIGGDAHFDNDEQWSDGSQLGVNFLFAATHELGHSLGLGHSSDPNAVMYPTYDASNSGDINLSEDDIKGIQALYGKGD
ncbi:matrilysin [Monodelphis domestica]|uniref:Peptidase metallopeptidase domain-containing protein n=1 Tax=Monodelphis domestica TaxID=13616 RepID=F6TAQ4_MONDO|nr:matrilysin [Monodelphis domestica]